MKEIWPRLLVGTNSRRSVKITLSATITPTAPASCAFITCIQCSVLFRLKTGVFEGFEITLDTKEQSPLSTRAICPSTCIKIEGLVQKTSTGYKVTPSAFSRAAITGRVISNSINSSSISIRNQATVSWSN